MAGGQDIQSAISPEVHQITILFADWAGNPADATTVKEITDEVNGAVHDYWSASTGGLIDFQVSAIQDWTPLPHSGCDRSGVTPTLWKDAQQAANWTPGPLKHFVIIVPSTSPCSAAFGGTAQKATSRTQGGMALLVSHDVNSFAHELGHTLGLGHSNGLICDDHGAVPDSTLPNCQVLPYGDFHDMMGLNLGQKEVLSAAGLERLGLTKGFVKVTTSGNYSLNVDYSEGPVRALSLTLDGNSYLLEYKSTNPKDTWSATGRTPAITGVAVYREISASDSMPGPSSSQVSIGDAFRLDILPYRVKINGVPDNSVGDAVASTATWYGLDSNKIWFQVLPTTTSTVAQVMVVVGSDPTSGKESFSKAINEPAPITQTIRPSNAPAQAPQNFSFWRGA